MGAPRRIDVRLPELQPGALGPFRWGLVDGRAILTNDAGEWEMLDPASLDELLAGRISPGHPLHERLARGCFVRDGSDFGALAARVRRKKAFLRRGPHLHVVITTLRCGQSCRYCHASRRPLGSAGTDMSPPTARDVVDRAMRTTSPSVTFEFQGGEPTLNMEAIRFVVDYATEKNRGDGKQLDFALVTGFSAMDEEKARWLVDRGVMVCTSLDGPRDLHDANRPWQPGLSSWDETVRWIRWFADRYAEAGRDPRTWHVDALLTTTRETLGRAREVVDVYADLGIRSIHLRPLHPFGFARRAWERIGYTTAEFLAFYEEALDLVIARNLEGTEMVEGSAAIVLAKLLTPDDPGYVDLRSPCGAGTGQVAWDHDGGVYPCDEARMLAAAGEPMFRIGEAAQGTLAGYLEHPTVRALALASTLEALPTCDQCWNQPFCGVCPLHDFQAISDLVGLRPCSDGCRRWGGISRMLLLRLARDGVTRGPGPVQEEGAGSGGEVARILRRWTLRRPRTNAGVGREP